MTRWQYRAYSANGEVISGRLSAESETAAFGTLERLGLSPISLRPLVRRTKKHLFKLGGNSQQDNLVFVKQLSTLMTAGIPMLNALASLAELQSDETERLKMVSVGEALRQGRSLSDAIKQHMPALPSYVPYLVEIGEETGDMSQALDSASVQLERDLAVSRDIKAALTYPMFLVAFGIAAVAFMFAVVVPQFSAMLNKSGAALPTISVVVITAGNFMRDHLNEMGLGVVTLVATLALLSRKAWFTEALFQMTLWLPGIGRVIRLNESTRWASMLATLLASRVTITQAILVANRIIKDRRLRTSLGLVENAIRRGARLSDSLEDFTTLDLRVVEMVRIGEQSGGLDRMLTSAADLLRAEADNARKRFIAMIEPLAVLVIGGCIGSIVVGLMLAISSIYDKVL